MLADPEAALAVVEGPNGIASAMEAGKRYVDVSTVDEACSQKISALVTQAGGRFLEAPVSGSKKPAIDGTLIFLCAGDESLYKECKPALGIMGKADFFLGDVGAGARMKLVVNMIMGSMMCMLPLFVTICDFHASLPVVVTLAFVAGQLLLSETTLNTPDGELKAVQAHSRRVWGWPARAT